MNTGLLQYALDHNPVVSNLRFKVSWSRCLNLSRDGGLDEYVNCGRGIDGFGAADGIDSLIGGCGGVPARGGLAGGATSGGADGDGAAPEGPGAPDGGEMLPSR